MRVWRERERRSVAAIAGYLFPALPPGNCDLSVEAKGFKKATRDAITLQVD